MQILFTDRALLTTTIRRMDKILGKVSLLPSYCPEITVGYRELGYRELHVYFPVQIPPFIDWT